MFPPIKAYKEGMLEVSPVHTIAYSLYGNPAGIVKLHCYEIFHEFFKI